MGDGYLMAHFAELDENNTILRVLVVGNDVTTIDGDEDEQRGIDFLTDLLPDSGIWVQTSYNDTIRGRYAGVGDTYDADRDAFLPPQPFPSWTLNDETLHWEPPAPRLIDTDVWDEESLSWTHRPAPYPSWTLWLDSNWHPPVPYPETPGDGLYEWDEDTTSWVEVE